MKRLFYGCSSLISIPDISKWKVNNLKYMSDLFSNCSSLLIIPDISKLNFNNIIDNSDIMKDSSFIKNNSIYSNNSNNNNISNSFPYFSKDIDDYFKYNANNKDYTNNNSSFYLT